MTRLLIGAGRLDLRLLELDVLADDRVVLLEDELVRRALAVLRGGVEVAGVGGRHEPDQLASCLGLLAHGLLRGLGLMAWRTRAWQALWASRPRRRRWYARQPRCRPRW